MIIKLLLFFILTLPHLQSIEFLVVETFDYPDGDLPETFWSEGCKAVIKEKRLFADADSLGHRASTIWFDKLFSGNLCVEFDVCIVSSKDNANNINFFFLFSDPSKESLRLSAYKRESGQYSFYHQLNGYIFTNVTTAYHDKDMEIRFRFRDNPGFKIIKEAFIIRENKGMMKHRIKIIKIDNSFQYWMDDEKILDVIDDKYNSVHEYGFIGLRTWHTSLWIDNLIVKKYQIK